MVKLKKIWVFMKSAIDIVSNKCFRQQFSLPGFSAILPMDAHSTGCGRCARSLCGCLPKCWLVPRFQAYSGLSSPNYFPIRARKKKKPAGNSCGLFFCARKGCTSGIIQQHLRQRRQSQRAARNAACCRVGCAGWSWAPSMKSLAQRRCISAQAQR